MWMYASAGFTGGKSKMPNSPGDVANAESSYAFALPCVSFTVRLGSFQTSTTPP